MTQALGYRPFIRLRRFRTSSRAVDVEAKEGVTITVAVKPAVSVIVGGVISGPAPVVKFHGLGTAPATNPLPLRSFAAFVIVAVNCVLAARFAPGTNVAVAPTKLTVPGTEAPPTPARATVNVPVAVTDAGSMALLNVAVIFWFTGTAVAPEAGTVIVTVGEVMSAVLPVVKFHTLLLARGLADALCAAVLIVAVYCVLGSRVPVGANIAVLVATT